MRKIGIIIVGTISCIFILAAILIQIFKQELVAWSPTAPWWIWYAVGSLVLIGIVGFILGRVGD